MSKVNKVVMSAIDKEVNWRDRGTQEQVVRYADENLAFSHPAVKERIRDLLAENRLLKRNYYYEHRYFEELLILTKVPLRNIDRVHRLLEKRATMTTKQRSR